MPKTIRMSREAEDRSPEAALEDSLNREEFEDFVIASRDPYPRTTAGYLLAPGPNRYGWKTLVWPCVQTPAEIPSNGPSFIEAYRPGAAIANSRRLLELPVSRTLLLGDVGQGKSVLLRMAAREIALYNKQCLKNNQYPLDLALLPIVVSAPFLGSQWPESGENNKTALARILGLSLENLTNDVAADYLVKFAHAHAHGCSSIASMKLDRTKSVGCLRNSNGGIASDPVIAQKAPVTQQLPFPTSVRHIARLLHEQVEEFIAKWFRTRKMHPALRVSSPSIRRRGVLFTIRSFLR